MPVTDEAVDLAMSAMPGRRIRFCRRGLALARAEVYRMLEAAQPALCAGECEQIRRQLGGWVERSSCSVTPTRRWTITRTCSGDAAARRAGTASCAVS